MKRALTRIFCLALVVIMSALMVGCKSDQDSFIGKWQAKINMTDLIVQKVKTLPDFEKHFKISDFLVTVNYDFYEDGSFIVKCDQDACTEAFEKAKAELVDGIANMQLESAKELGLDMTLDEILAASNTTMDEMLAKYIDDNVLAEIFDGFEYSGFYKAENGRFYRVESLEDETAELPYESYKIIDDNKIEITDAKGFLIDKNQKEMIELIYPILLQKI